MRPWYRELVLRLLLVVWLGVFSFQSGNLLVLVAADDCVQLATDRTAGDPCPDTCARCVCCARVAASVSSDVMSAPVDRPVVAAALAEFDFPTSAEPHGILHVPKTR